MTDAPSSVDGGSADDASSSLPDAGSSLSDAGAPDAGGSASLMTYSVTRDARRCAFPACGGFWLEAVNQSSTRCLDGTRMETCYVAALDWSATGLSSVQTSGAEAQAGRLLLDGVLGAAEVSGVVGQPILLVDAAWKADWGPVASPPSSGVHYGLADNGVRCFTYPCFSMDATRLNVGTVELVSGVNLDGAGASPDKVAAGIEALADGTLRAIGAIATDSEPGPAGFGETFVATQFFLPILP